MHSDPTAPTAPSSAMPIYHDPSQTRPRTRRSSTRRSFVSPLSRSASQIDQPRTLCPKDGDAFSYSPSHLRAWYAPRDLWDRLPAQVQANLSAMQHAGASVLTGFERLDKHTEELDGHRPDHKVPEDELLVQLDELLPTKFRTESNASSIFMSDVSSPAYTSSNASDSGCASPVSTFSQPATMPALSPFSLSPPEMAEKRTLSRNRSFSTPLEPQDAYYATELSYLRTEALPRLRHSALKVDTDWYEAKRTGSVTDADVATFEAWWVEKKCNILSLNEKGKRLAVAIGITSTGMGWTAP